MLCLYAFLNRIPLVKHSHFHLDSPCESVSGNKWVVFRARDQAETGECARRGFVDVCGWTAHLERYRQEQTQRGWYRDGSEIQLILVVMRWRRAETEVAFPEMRYWNPGCDEVPVSFSDYISGDKWRSSLWLIRYYFINVIIRGRPSHYQHENVVPQWSLLVPNRFLNISAPL